MGSEMCIRDRYRLVLAAVKKFYEKGIVQDEEEGQATEIRESLERRRKKKEKEKPLPFLTRTPEQKIRKYFIRTVRKLGAPKDCRTARELLETVPAPESEKEKAVGELLRLYEKARYYGNCSKEEAELAVHAAETIAGKKKSI